MLSLGDMIKKTQPTLFWCMRSLSKSKREAVFALFAFCRHLDMVTRSDMPIKDKLELLKAWQEELNNIYIKKVPQTNIGRKIYKNCMRFNLPEKLWQDILESAFLKINPSSKFPDNEEFKKYVRGSAEIPLQLALMVIEPEHLRAGEELAKNLGRAVMLTYMLRDVKDDAKSNQLYLPAEVLEASSVHLGTAREIIEDKNFMYVREKIAEQAESGYVKAERLLLHMDYADTRVFRLLHNLGRCQFEIMQKRGWEIMSPKPHINFIKRLNILYHTLFG